MNIAERALIASNASMLRVYGSSVEYQQLPGAAIAINVLKGVAHKLEDPSPAYERIWVPFSAIAAPANGDLVTMGGVCYVVVKVGPPDGGGAWLNLNQTERDPDA